MALRNWSTTASANNSNPPNGWPEGMAPSAVNNTARQLMADIRTWYEDPLWIDYGDTPTRVDDDTITVATDLTARYAIGRRLKIVGATTGYASIVSVSYSAPDTTINVQMDSGNVPNTLTALYAGPEVTSGPLPTYHPRTAAEIAAGVTPTDYSYPSGDVRRYGAKADGSNSTTAFANAIASDNRPYAPAGTWNVDTIAINRSGVHLRTDGLATIIQQNSGTSDTTVVINVSVSNVIVDSVTVKGNISTDSSEFHHAVQVYNDAANIQNVTIGDIYAQDIRGDALYIGTAVGYTNKYCKFGRVVGKNVLRNIVSIVGASHVRGDAAIVDTSCGYVTLDIEPNDVVSSDIYVGLVRGGVFQCSPATLALAARRIHIGHMDLDPSYQTNTTPTYGSYSVSNAIQLRNTIDLRIDHLKMNGHTGLGINYIWNSGEQPGESIHIGYVQASSIGASESTYNTVMLVSNVQSLTIDDGDVALDAVGDTLVLGDSSAKNTRLIVNRMRIDGTLVRFCKSSRLSQITINSTNAVEAFRDVQDTVILDSDITLPKLLNNGSGVTFINVNATCSTSYCAGSLSNITKVNTYFGGVSSNGSITLGAAASTTVNNANVEAASKIILTPTNAAAATLMGSNKALYVSARTAGTSFVVSTASGASAAGTETFDYSIH